MTQGPTPQDLLQLRIRLAGEAKVMVENWLSFMRTHKLTECCFTYAMPQSDMAAMQLGHVGEQLRDQGAIIVSHSHALIGQQENPRNPETPLFIQQVSLWIRSDGKLEVPRIVLG